MWAEIGGGPGTSACPGTLLPQLVLGRPRRPRVTGGVVGEGCQGRAVSIPDDAVVANGLIHHGILVLVAVPLEYEKTVEPPRSPFQGVRSPINARRIRGKLLCRPVAGNSERQ